MSSDHSSSVSAVWGLVCSGPFRVADDSSKPSVWTWPVSALGVALASRFMPVAPETRGSERERKGGRTAVGSSRCRDFASAGRFDRTWLLAYQTDGRSSATRHDLRTLTRNGSCLQAASSPSFQQHPVRLPMDVHSIHTDGYRQFNRCHYYSNHVPLSAFFVTPLTLHIPNGMFRHVLNGACIKESIDGQPTLETTP